MIAQRQPDEIERIRASCQIVFQVQQVLEQAIAPGVTTAELDALAEETIRACGAQPAFKGYHGFPASICASLNDETVHGFPSGRRLCTGDILSVDVGVQLDGYYGDGAFTIGVGLIRPELEHLLETTRACLDLGADQARAGNRLSDISHAIQHHAETHDLTVVRKYGGHGIGLQLHEEPHILNYGQPGKGPRLRAGYVFAIEPIISMGSADLVTADDGWTTTTEDGAPTAHFEHTVAITEDGPEILTLPQKNPAFQA
jgi:methionyl aminopeptidase